jgi:Ca2+:H+ antiporter
MYLLFQLKSHAYLYESTPQHIIDEESAPGPVAAWMDSSSSDDDSSSGSDSDGSRGSNTTAGRIRRVMRGGRRRRKSSAGSRDTDPPAPTRTPSYAASTGSPMFPDVFTEEPVMSPSAAASHRFGSIELGNDGDNDMVKSRENQSISFNERNDRKSKKERRHRKRRHNKSKGVERLAKESPNEKQGDALDDTQADGFNEPRRVDFAVPDSRPQTNESAQKKPFSLRGIRPAIPKTFSQNVFTQPARTGSPNIQEAPIITGPIPHVRYGIRRTNSLPDRLNQASAGTQVRLPLASRPMTPSNPAMRNPVTTQEENISRTTAVVLLLISTGLVAVCANFMVDSIDSVTKNTSLGATFVGLILLPIIGNAAEHVTAVTVAAKNKMDLAIGVAVGSSIQIGMLISTSSFSYSN